MAPKSKSGGAAAFFSAIQQAAYGVLYLTAKKSAMPRWLVYLQLLVKVVQLLAFIFHGNVGVGWSPILTWWHATTTTSNLSILSLFHSSTAHTILYFLATAIVLLLVGLLAFGVASFASTITVLWPLRLLRFIGSLIAGFLYIPLLQMLLSAFDCVTHPGDFDYCGSSTLNAAQMVISSVLAVILLLFALVFAAVLFESHPLSLSDGARAHGRAHVLMVLIDTMLVLVVNTFASQVAFGALLAFLGVAGVAWLLIFVALMPFYDYVLNYINIMGAAVYLWAFVCLLINNGFAPGASDAVAALFLAGAPFAALAGHAVASWRLMSIFKCPPSRLLNAYDVEIKCRLLLHAALHGHPYERLGVEAAALHTAALQAAAAARAEAHQQQQQLLLETPPGEAAGAQRTTSRLNGAAATAAAFSGGGRGGGKANLDDAQPLQQLLPPSQAADAPSAHYGYVASASASAARAGGAGRNGGGDGSGGGGGGGAALDGALDDVDERALAYRRLLPPAAVAEVTGIYRAAAAALKGSSIIYLFLARHYAVFVGNRHLHVSSLVAAERRRPAPDVACLVFAARRETEDSAATGGGSTDLSALARIAFEKHSRDARHNVLRAAARMAAFWGELLDPQPDISRLHRLNHETSAAIDAADAAFAELQTINSQSLAVMRLCASFCQHVKVDTEKALALAAEADRIDEARSKAHGEERQQRLQLMAESRLDLWVENTALVTIAADARDVGIVLAANAPACKLFGLTRTMLERRSAFTLLPRALAAWLEASLRGYSDSGDVENACIDHTRALYVYGKDRALVPVLSSVRNSPLLDGRTTFLWVLRELQPAAAHILCNPAFGLLAADAASMALLNTDAAALESSALSLTDFVAEVGLPAVQAELASPHGCMLRVDALLLAGGDDEGDASDDGGADSDGAGGRSSDDGEDSDGGCMSSPHSGGSDPRRRALQTLVTPASALASPTASGPLGRRSDRRRFVVSSLSRKAATDSIVARGAAAADSSGALGSSRGAAAAAATVESSWVRAYLQRINFDGLQLAVLQWKRVAATELHAIAKAEARRTELLLRAAAGAVAGAVAAKAPPPQARQWKSLRSMSTPAATLRAPETPSGAAAQREAGGDPAAESASRFGRAAAATVPLARVSESLVAADAPLAAAAITAAVEEEEDTAAAAAAPHRPGGMAAQQAGGGGGGRSRQQKSSSRRISRASSGAGGAALRVSIAGDSTVVDGDSTAVSFLNLEPGALSPAAAATAGASSTAMSPSPASKARAGAFIPRSGDDGGSGSPIYSDGGGRGASVSERGSGAGAGAGAFAERDGAATSHTSRSSHAERTLGRLRHALSEEHQPLLPGLRWLLIVGVGMTLLAIGLAAAVAVLVFVVFGQYGDAVSYLGMASQRILYKESALRALQGIMFSGRGFVPLNASALEELRAEALSNITQFSAVHSAMFTLAQTSTAAIAAEWGDSYVSVNLFGVSSNVAYLDYLVLTGLSAGAYLASLLQSLADASAAVFADPSNALVLAGMTFDGVRHGNLHEVLENSAVSSYAQTLSLTQSTTAVVAGVLSGMCCLLVVISGAVFLPILRSVNRAGDAIILQFIGLAPRVRRRMLAVASERLRYLRRQYADDYGSDSDSDEGADGDGGDADGDGGGDAELLGQETDTDWAALADAPAASSRRKLARSSRARVHPLTPTSPAPAAGDAASVASSSADPLTPGAGAAGSRSGGANSARGGGGEGSGSMGPGSVGSYSRRYAPTARQGGNGGGSKGGGAPAAGPAYRKSSRAFLLLALRFVGPLGLLFVLFLALIVDFLVTINSAATLTAVSAAANKRASCARGGTTDMRKLVYIDVESSYLTPQYWYTLDAFECVLWHTTLLGQGTPQGPARPNTDYRLYSVPVENGQPSVLTAAATTKVYGAMYGDACAFLRDNYYNTVSIAFNYSECAAFNNGVMLRGLSDTILQWNEDAKTVADRQLRSSYIFGEVLAGIGWEMPQDTFNYTECACLLPACDIFHSFMRPADGSPLPLTISTPTNFPGSYPPNAPPGSPNGPPANSTVYSTAVELRQRSDFLRIEEVDEKYLTPGLYTLAALYDRETKDLIAGFVNFVIVFVVVYMSAFLLVILFFFLPSIRRTNRDIVAKRKMLLYLPAALVRTPAIKNLIEEILQRENDLAGSSSRPSRQPSTASRE